MTTDVRDQRSESGVEGRAPSRPIFDLSHLRSTEDAERLGPSLMKDQFLFLMGARSALLLARPLVGPDDRVKLITLASVYREAMELAPYPTLCSLLKNNFAASHADRGEPGRALGTSAHETAAAKPSLPYNRQPEAKIP